MSNDISPTSPTPPRPAPEVAAPRPVAPEAQPVQPVAASAKRDEPVKPAPLVDPEVSRRELEQAIKRLNEQVQKNSFNLNFSVDEATNHVVVKVRDAQSGEVLRQIPSEAVLRLAENLPDLKGLLRDQKI